MTEHPTTQWTAHQISEAFPWESAPRYLIRDRDRVYGLAFRKRVECMGIEEVLASPRSPWQNPFVERVIGSIRRECLDHVIVLHAGAVTAPSPWTARRSACARARARHVVQVAEAGGLYRHYERRAA